MSMDPLASKVARRFASRKESERLKAVQQELYAISARLDELADEAHFSPETQKALPKNYRAKSTWFGFDKADEDIRRVAGAAHRAGTAIQMGINLAEVVESTSTK